MVDDDGEDTDNLRSSEGRSFQSRGAVWDMARLENFRRLVTGGRERVKYEDDRVERVGWMMKSSRRYLG